MSDNYNEVLNILAVDSSHITGLSENRTRRITAALLFQNTKYWWRGNISTTQANREEEEEPFFEIPNEDDNNNEFSWDPRHLEYSFAVQIGDNSNNRIVLDASEYKEDHLDWYSFTVDPKRSAAQLPPSSSSSPSSLSTYRYIPTHLKFAGMPEKRWWNFEDSHVDFGSIAPKTNNIVTTLMMEFALVHSPDWYIIPHQMEVGMISQIQSLIVKDCFGGETTIEPAGRTARERTMAQSDNSWDSWNMFTLSKTYEEKGEQHDTPYFFLPPTLDNSISGPPLEEIRFLRDETANLTWAVEKQFRTLYGEPVSGYDHYISQKEKFVSSQQNASSSGGPSATNAIDNKDKAAAKYTLMTSVPWNWIPFIPVHTSNFLRESSSTLTLHTHIELQRAAMINALRERTIIIRPNSRLLNEVQPHYYIDESEVPRSGAIVSEKCQRTVWSNGRVFLWIGRKKTVGSGEGSSGLKFDYIPLRREV